MAVVSKRTVLSVLRNPHAYIMQVRVTLFKWHTLHFTAWLSNVSFMILSYITLQIVTMVFLAVVVGFIYFQIDDNKSSFGLTNRYLVFISFPCRMM